MNHQDTLRLANKKAKGKRPYFLDAKENEVLLSLTMTLAMELSVTRERLSTLESILQAKGFLLPNDIDSYQPSDAEQHARSEAQQALIARVLRIVQQEIEALEE